MIEQAVSEIAPLVGTAPACRVLGASRASLYRWRSPAPVGPPRPKPVPARMLSQEERAAVLEQPLWEDRFVDAPPAQGLYTSHPTAWRKQRDTGALKGLEPRKRGPRGQTPDQVELAGVRRRRERAETDFNRRRALGGAVRDAQVPARVPRPVRLDPPRPRVLPPVFPLVQRGPSPLRDRPDAPPSSTTASPSRPTPPAKSSSTPPTPPTQTASSGAHHGRRPCRRAPGSTSPTPRRLLTKFVPICLTELDRLPGERLAGR